jgi:hypothetical protein
LHLHEYFSKPAVWGALILHIFPNFALTMKTFDLANIPRLDAKARPGVLSAREAAALVPAEVHNASRRAVAAGVLLLWHDHWDAAHQVAQTDEGERDHDLLHGIAHRREGDFGNSGYWFRGAGDHPCFPDIAKRVAAVIPADHALRAKILPGGKWDPLAFVATVKKGLTGPDEPLLRAIQAQEFIAYYEWLIGKP